MTENESGEEELEVWIAVPREVSDTTSPGEPFFVWHDDQHGQRWYAEFRVVSVSDCSVLVRGLHRLEIN